MSAKEGMYTEPSQEGCWRFREANAPRFDSSEKNTDAAWLFSLDIKSFFQFMSN